MQQTPPCPPLQGNQFSAAYRLHIPQSNHPFAFAVTGQPVKQCPSLANVQCVANCRIGAYSQPVSYKLLKLNIHVMFGDVHAFFSLRYESDFSVATGQQRLLEAEQLNFWKAHSSSPYKLCNDLEAQPEGHI